MPALAGGGGAGEPRPRCLCASLLCLQSGWWRASWPGTEQSTGAVLKEGGVQAGAGLVLLK